MCSGKHFSKSRYAGEGEEQLLLTFAATLLTRNISTAECNSASLSNLLNMGDNNWVTWLQITDPGLQLETLLFQQLSRSESVATSSSGDDVKCWQESKVEDDGWCWNLSVGLTTQSAVSAVSPSPSLMFPPHQSLICEGEWRRYLQQQQNYVLLSVVSSPPVIRPTAPAQIRHSRTVQCWWLQWNTWYLLVKYQFSAQQDCSQCKLHLKTV